MSPGHLPVLDNSIDIVTIVELLEHITEEEATQLLGECRRVLRPGGRLVVSTPNYGFLWPVLEFFINRFGKVSYHDQHVTHYRSVGLQKLLDRCNLIDTHVETYLFFAPFFAVLSWSLAGVIAELEPRCLTQRFGHLLIGCATKP
jgi:predicted SAM-dependent methyltransferase